MADEIKIERIASTEMFGRCAEVLMDAYNRPPWNDNWNKEAAIALLTCYYNSPEFMGWTATTGNIIVGCGVGNIEPYYKGSIFYLKELFVAARYQKAGVGKRLVSTVKQDLAKADVKTIILLTSDAIFNFYTKCGFSGMEERRIMIYSNSE
ncbi:MAG: GNAT family N-acetyltransferase [Mucilaginibacter sp.]